MTRRKFLIQGAVLTAVSLLLRVTNMGYRSFLSQEMGAAGMGLYQLIFSIFMLTVTAIYKVFGLNRHGKVHKLEE